MRRHESHSSAAADGHSQRVRNDRLGVLAAAAGNRAVSELLAHSRPVQRSPAGGAPFEPEEIDYYNLKKPKSLDPGFRPQGGRPGLPDTGFTVPSHASDDMSLGYGGTGDEGFRPDYHAQGGRHGSDPGLGRALQGRDPLGGTVKEPDLPIPPAGLPVPGEDPDLGAAALDLGGSLIGGVSAFAQELPFVQDVL